MNRYNDFRIANRHLSESDCRESYCRRTGSDEYDFDRAIRRERDDRNAYYNRLDTGVEE